MLPLAVMRRGTENHSQTLCGKSLNSRSLLEPSPQSQGNMFEGQEERLWESEEMECTRGTLPTESSNQGSQKLKQQT